MRASGEGMRGKFMVRPRPSQRRLGVAVLWDSPASRNCPPTTAHRWRHHRGPRIGSGVQNRSDVCIRLPIAPSTPVPYPRTLPHSVSECGGQPPRCPSQHRRESMTSLAGDISTTPRDRSSGHSAAARCASAGVPGPRAQRGDRSPHSESSRPDARRYLS